MTIAADKQMTQPPSRRRPPHRMMQCYCGASLLFDEGNQEFVGPLEYEQTHLTIGSVGVGPCAKHRGG